MDFLLKLLSVVNPKARAKAALLAGLDALGESVKAELDDDLSVDEVVDAVISKVKAKVEGL